MFMKLLASVGGKKKTIIVNVNHIIKIESISELSETGEQVVEICLNPAGYICAYLSLDEIEKALGDLNAMNYTKKQKETHKNNNLFKLCEDLELSIRTRNCLQNAGIEYVYQLVQKTERELLKIKNFGRKSLFELIEILKEMNLRFGMTLDRSFIASFGR